MIEHVRQTLLAAADYIERHGWYQGVAFGPSDDSRPPPACAFGAIQQTVMRRLQTLFDETCTPSDVVDESCRVVEEYLGLPRDNFYRRLPRWNDARERTAAEVVAALRGAAESVEVLRPTPELLKDLGDVLTNLEEKS